MGLTGIFSYMKTIKNQPTCRWKIPGPMDPSWDLIQNKTDPRWSLGLLILRLFLIGIPRESEYDSSWRIFHVYLIQDSYKYSVHVSYGYVIIYQHCIQQFKLHDHSYCCYFQCFKPTATASTTIFSDPPKGCLQHTNWSTFQQQKTWRHNFLLEPTPLEKNMFKSNWINIWPKLSGWICQNPQIFELGTTKLFLTKVLTGTPIGGCGIVNIAVLHLGCEDGWRKVGWRWKLFEMLRLKRCNCWIHEEKMVVYFPKKRRIAFFFLDHGLFGNLEW